MLYARTTSTAATQAGLRLRPTYWRSLLAAAADAVAGAGTPPGASRGWKVYSAHWRVSGRG